MVHLADFLRRTLFAGLPESLASHPGRVEKGVRGPWSR